MACRGVVNEKLLTFARHPLLTHAPGRGKPSRTCLMEVMLVHARVMPIHVAVTQVHTAVMLFVHKTTAAMHVHVSHADAHLLCTELPSSTEIAMSFSMSRSLCHASTSRSQCLASTSRSPCRASTLRLLCHASTLRLPCRASTSRLLCHASTSRTPCRAPISRFNRHTHLLCIALRKYFILH